MEDNKYYEDEISVKDIIIRVQEYARELLRYWWYPILFIIPILLYKVYKTINTPTQFSTQTKFLVEGQGGGGSGGLGGLLGSFGINRDSKSNPFKIIEVARSKSLVSEVLFSKSALTNDYLINDIIDNYKLNEKWGENNPAMADLRFTHDSVAIFNPLERSAFLSVFRKVVGTEKNRDAALFKININQDSGIFTLDAKTVNENTTLSLVNGIYSTVEYFFENKIVNDQLRTVSLLKTKADSLDNLIGSKMLQMTRIDDRNRGTILNESNYGRQKLMLEIQGLTNAYAEALKTYEMADYNLKSSTPSFMLIDQPYLPLTRAAPSLVTTIVMSIILGGLLAGIFIIGRKTYRTVMA